MEKYYVGRSIKYIIVDELDHFNSEMARLAEAISANAVHVIPNLGLAYDDGTFKERQKESNDWRRKSKRGFNGYHRHV